MELERFVTETGRPLPIFLLLDCSGSMSGEKINTLWSGKRDEGISSDPEKCPCGR